MKLVEKTVPLAVTAFLFTSIAFVTIVLRLFTRLIVIKNAGADDYCMVVAMCASIGFLIVVIYQIEYGLGVPFQTIEPAVLPKFFQALWATIPVYNVALTFCKLSIICQYIRVFSTEKVQKLCKIMIGILIVYGCWTFFGSVFMCIPVQAFWNEGTGKCMNKLAFWFSNAALNIATDVLIFAIPVPLIRSLQISRKQRIALMFVFAFGAFVCVTSVIRLRSLYLISISTDTSLDGVDCAIWSGIEINVAISCASLPTLRPLISRAFPGLLSSHNKSGPSGKYGNLSNSHQLQSIRTKPGQIQVDQTIELKAEQISIGGGSERNLVGWGVERDTGVSDDTDRKGVRGREMV